MHQNNDRAYEKDRVRLIQALNRYKEAIRIYNDLSNEPFKLDSTILKEFRRNTKRLAAITYYLKRSKQNPAWNPMKGLAPDNQPGGAKTPAQIAGGIKGWGANAPVQPSRLSMGKEVMSLAYFEAFLSRTFAKFDASNDYFKNNYLLAPAEEMIIAGTTIYLTETLEN